MGSAAGLADVRRLRSGTTLTDTSKRRYLKSGGRSFTNPASERSCNSKLHSLKIIGIIFGAILILLYFPVVYYTEHLPHSVSRPRFIDGWMWDRSISDSRYLSDSNVNWVQIVKAIDKLEGRKRHLNVGLLNFNITELNKWQQLLPHSESSVIYLDYAGSNVTWEDLYPEWIDEEEESEVPLCANLPEPKVSAGSLFDLVAVKLPSNNGVNWSRDIARLHLQLSAARVAANYIHDHDPVHVLFVTDFFPIPNLFLCKHLVVREGNVWLYKPELEDLREKLSLPIGSCELALPLNKEVRPMSTSPLREAYATILHSEHFYVCGAIVAARSIRLAGSIRDLVILVDKTISDHHKEGLEAAGWKIRTIERIRNPKAERDAYNEWNYSKFRLWQLTDYDKIIFIDADLLILRNIDFLFAMPEISAIGNNATLFNSGVMLVEPSNCTFQLLMDHINEIESYNGGDQGYLNEIFTWWHRIPKDMNFLKHFWFGDEPEKITKKISLFGAEPPILYVLHYLGLKPWVCFRDYDCNWNVEKLHEFASDVAHARWWKVHDTMTEKLQGYCLLRTKQKASLEWDRREAGKAKYPDGHWKRNITDPRLKICFEEFCFWESMLWHWGDANWTDYSSPSTAASL